MFSRLIILYKNIIIATFAYLIGVGMSNYY